MKVNIRPVQRYDIHELIGMMRDLYAADGDTPFDEKRARVAVALLLDDHRWGHMFLIVSGAAVVGYMVVAFGFSVESGGRNAFLDELYIREGWRGQGVGTRAIRLAEEVCRSNGIKVILLEVERTNTPAQKLYERAGFRRHTRYVMSKRIT